MAEEPAYTVQIVRDVLADSHVVFVSRDNDGRTEHLTHEGAWVRVPECERRPCAAEFRSKVWAAIVSEIKGN